MKENVASTKSVASFIGRYQLESKLGEGATGIVYRAYDPLMDRNVAIKSVKTESMTREDIREVIDSFHHEAKIAGKYAHENIIAIYDLISHGEIDHIIMEYVPGRSVLDYIIAVGPMDVDEVLAIVYKCCVAMSYIHFNGVVHRDIKPGNIMYHPAQGIVKLMDFSVAHNIEEPPVRDTGTIAYMAPEHFDPMRKITLFTDIFALGSTMYRMLVKEYPFTRKNVAFQILYQEPKPLTDYRSDIPDEIGIIVNKAMAKADKDRYQSAAQFAMEVKDVFEKLYPDSNLLNADHNYMST